MADTRLEMTFKNQLDKKTRMSIDNPKGDLTSQEVSTVMNDLITRNIFTSSGGDLVAISGARVITTDVQELEL